MPPVKTNAWQIIVVILGAVLLLGFEYTHDIKILIACTAMFVIAVIVGTAASTFYLVLFLVPQLAVFKAEEMPFSFATVLLLLCFAKHLVSQARRMCIALFPLGATISVIAYEWTHALHYTDGMSIEVLRWSVLLLYAVLLVIDHNFRYDHKRAVHALSVGLLLSAISEMATKPTVDLPAVAGRIQRFEGAVGDPNGYGMIGIIVVFLLFSIYKQEEGRKARYVICATGILLLCLRTYSRAFVVTWAAMLGILLLYAFRRGNSRARVFVGSIMALGGVAILWSRTFFKEWVDIMIQRFSLWSSGDVLAPERIGIVAEYWSRFLASSRHVFLGSGLMGYMQEYELEYGTHNTYLEVLVSWGGIGALNFGIFLYSLYWATKCKHGKRVAKVDAWLPLVAMAVYLISLQSLAKYSTYFLLVLVLGNIFYRQASHDEANA